MKFPLKSRTAGRMTWDRRRENFLYIPGVMAPGAVLLACYLSGSEDRQSTHHCCEALKLKLKGPV
jgi:hypothetical protein